MKIDKSKTRGKRVKKMKVIRTNVFLPPLSAQYATGTY